MVRFSSSISDAQRLQCHAIIHAASTASAAVGFGLAQLPFADTLAITPVQVTMVIALGRVFGIELDQSVASAMGTTAASQLLGKQLALTLVTKVPGLGNCINAVTAAGFTESLGWLIANDFAKRQSR